MIRKEAWTFYRTSSGVRLCWELEEPKGPKGHACPKPGVVAAPALRAALRAVPRAALRPRGRDGWVPVPHPGVGGVMGLLRMGLAVPGRLVRTLTSR